MRENKNKMNGLMFVIALGLVGCSKSGSSDGASTSTPDYFAAAKGYISASTPFGAQTSLADGLNIKIEFDPSVTTNSGSLGVSNVGYLATFRKKLTMSEDKTLIMIERIQASQKDGTTMTVTMRSGKTAVRVTDLSGSHREKAYQDDQCERIIFNATGQGVCLNTVAGVVQMTKLSPKFGERVVTACRSTIPGKITCGRRDKLVSRKEIENGVVNWTAFNVNQ